MRKAVLRAVEPEPIAQANLESLERLAERIRPQDSALREWFERYYRTHSARLAADLQILENHAEPHAAVVEYGAVPLLMTAALAERGYRVRALDLAPERFSDSIATLGLDVQRCDIETEKVPFSSRTFDVALFNELFEHLRVNPIFTLEETHRVLKSDGILLLSTPNLRSFRGLRNLLVHSQAQTTSGGVYEQYEKLATLGHVGHVREYTPREVADFLTRVGFRVEKVIFRGGHGSGLVGLAERLAPSFRPSFTLVASKIGESSRHNGASQGSSGEKEGR